MRPFRQLLPGPTLLLSLFLAVLLGGSGLHAAWAAVRVAVIADYGDNSPNEAAVADLVHSFVPDIVVTAGDNSYDAGPIDTNIGKYYSRYIGNYSGGFPPGSSINRFFPCLGNHDYGDGGGVNAYLNYFALPGASVQSSNTSGNERYYDFVYGPIHFFAINSNPEEPNGRDSTSVQAQWLRSQLAASNAPWKIVYFHHTAYSSGEHGGALPMRWPFRQWGADAVIAAHDHDYERFLFDGFPYFVVGIGGSGLRGFRTTQPGSVVRYAANFGAMLITADAGELSFDTFSIASGNPLVDSYTLFGEGSVPQLTVSPLQYQFASVTVGAMALTSFGLRNDGDVTLNVQSIALAGPHAGEFSAERGADVMPRRLPQIASTFGPFVVPPGSVVPVVVRFLPVTVGAKNAVLRIVSDDPNRGTAEFPLTGVAIPEYPDITVSPPAVDFGPAQILTSATGQVKLHNWGRAILQVSSALTGGDLADFAITAGSGPFAVAPGESAAVSFTFAPTTLGPKATTLRLQSNDPDTPVVDVPLSGVSVVQNILVTPLVRKFASTDIFTYRRTFVWVRNTGTGALQVSAVSFLGPQASAFSITAGGGAFTVAPGDSSRMTIQFAPVTAGNKNATLRIQSNDPDTPALDVAFSGTGLLPPYPIIVASPPSRDFGSVAVMASTSAGVWVRNAGGVVLQVSALSLLGPQAAEFAVTSGGAFSVASTDSVQIGLAFTPLTLGSRSATLRIQSDDPQTPALDVALSGVGLRPVIAVSPTGCDFGGALLGSGAAMQVLEVRNEGNEVLAVSQTSITGAGAGNFAITSGGGPFSVAPGSSATVSLRFAPSSAGVKTATLRLQSNDPEQANLEVALSGIGVAATGGRLPILFQESVEGASSNSISVTTSRSVTAVNGALYLAAVSARPLTAVSSVAGLGLVWSRVRGQCSARSQTGVEIWVGSGTPSTGVVTATFVSPTSSAALLVSRYVNSVPTAPLRAVVSANTNGVQGICSNGTDTASFSMNLQATAGGSLVFIAAAMRNRDLSVGSGTTLRAAVHAGSGGAITGLATADRQLATTGNVNLSGSFGQSVDWAVAAVEIAPAIVFAEITVTPGSHDYGALNVGTSGSTSFVIRNDGSATLQVPGIGLLGPQSADFALTSGATAPPLAPGASHTVNVRFAPAGGGTRSALLRIVSDDPDEVTLDLPLTGTGIPVVPDLAVSPASLNFGSIPALTFTSFPLGISNLGTAILQVTQITVTGPDASSFVWSGAALPISLVPGDGTALGLSFVPTTQGTKSAALRLVSNDPDQGTLDVPLSGTALPPLLPDIAVLPGSLDFGTTTVFSSRAGNVRVRNQGTAALHVTGSAIVGTDSLSFALGSSGTFTLAPGDSTNVALTFTPTSSGPKSARLRLTSDDPDENPVLVVLTGTGVAIPHGNIVFQGIVQGGSSNSTSVTTASSVPVQSGNLVLAAVATKAYVNVTAVTGLGLTWTRVRAQCGGRSQTGVEVWLGTGSPSPGLVTASFASAPTSAALLVARYSGADPVTPLGAMVSANTQGVGGPCSGGVDTAAYAMSLQTTVNDAVVFQAVAMRSRILTPGSGYVLRNQFYAGPSGSVAGLAVADRVFASPGTVNVNGSFDGSVDWAVVGIVIRPHLVTAKQEALPETVQVAGLLLGYSAGTAWFELAAPQPVHARLRVLDVRGRLQTTLYDGVLPAGRTRLPWGGGVDDAVLPSGIYFLEAEIGGQRFVRKALLLR